MNDKKRKIEKEQSKYDVDRDTQAKAQNVQHLTQMSKYLPLFTKKIKDPKAIKKSPATKELDYSNHKHHNQETAQQQQNDDALKQDNPLKLIEDQQLSTFKHRKTSEKILEQHPEQDDIALLERENQILRKEVETKKLEQEKANYKYAKAQSQFIEIMRELSRFRNEFNDTYSLRSKLLKTQEITQNIESLLKTKNEILFHEQQQLKNFQQSAQKLFGARKSIISNVSLSQSPKSSKREQALTTAQKLKNQSKFCENVKTMRINNINCFVQYEIDKKKAQCKVTLFTQIHQEQLSYIFKGITERFDPESEIQKLQFVSNQGELKIELNEKVEDGWIEHGQNDIYYRVPNTLVKYINGSPFRLLTVKISQISQRDTVCFTVTEKDFNRQQYTVEVPQTKIFKHLLSPTCTIEDFEEELFGHNNRYFIITQAFSTYIRKHMQIGEFERDINPLSPSSGLFRPKQSLHDLNSKLSLVDREVRGVKKRYSQFVGTRKSLAQFGLSPNMTNRFGSEQRRSSQGSNQTMKTNVQNSLEKMRDAINQYLNSKKNTSKQQSPDISPRLRGASQKKTQDNRMNQIMQLIYANSLFASIHSEIYEVSLEEKPIFIELVHNTDDDSLIILMIQDPIELKIKEIVLNDWKDKNWQFLKNRYGHLTESLLENVETMFRSLEFYNMIKIAHQKETSLSTQLRVPTLLIEKRKRSDQLNKEDNIIKII